MSTSSDQTNTHNRALEAQLVIGLKFHYPETLKNIPLDVALNAMTAVWKSCQEVEDQSQEIDDQGQANVIHL